MFTRIISASNRLLLRLLTVAICMAAAAGMVELSPGSGIDSRVLDSRLSDDQLDRLGEHKFSDTGWLAKLLNGDLGDSVAYGRPVVELIRERVPLTAALVRNGIAIAWSACLTGLVASALSAPRIIGSTLSGISGVFLSIPSALAAFLCVVADWPPEIAVGGIVSSGLYRYASALAANEARREHVLAALSRGARRSDVAFQHILRPISPTVVTALGVSVTSAIGAAVAVEVVSDIPGIGQLVWDAALSRDFPVIVALTGLVAAVTVTANFVADVGAAALEGART